MGDLLARRAVGELEVVLSRGVYADDVGAAVWRHARELALEVALVAAVVTALGALIAWSVVRPVRARTAAVGSVQRLGIEDTTAFAGKTGLAPG